MCCVCVAHAANIGARGQTAPEEKGVSGRKGRFHPNLQERPLKNGCRELQTMLPLDAYRHRHPWAVLPQGFTRQHLVASSFNRKHWVALCILLVKATNWLILRLILLWPGISGISILVQISKHCFSTLFHSLSSLFHSSGFTGSRFRRNGESLGRLHASGPARREPTPGPLPRGVLEKRERPKPATCFCWLRIY